MVIDYDDFENICASYKSLKSYLLNNNIKNFLNIEDHILDFYDIRKSLYKEHGMIYYTHVPIYKTISNDSSRNHLLIIKKDSDIIYVALKLIVDAKFCRMIHLPISKNRNLENESLILNKMVENKAVSQIYVNDFEKLLIQNNKLECKNEAYIDYFFNVEERFNKVSSKEYKHKHLIKKCLNNTNLQFKQIRNISEFQKCINLHKQWCDSKESNGENVRNKQMLEKSEKFVVGNNNLFCYALYFKDYPIAVCLYYKMHNVASLISEFNISKFSDKYSEVDRYISKNLKNLFDYLMVLHFHDLGITTGYLAGIADKSNTGLTLQKNMRKTGEILYTKYENVDGVKNSS